MIRQPQQEKIHDSTSDFALWLLFPRAVTTIGVDSIQRGRSDTPLGYVYEHRGHYHENVNYHADG